MNAWKEGRRPISFAVVVNGKAVSVSRMPPRCAEAIARTANEDFAKLGLDAVALVRPRPKCRP